MTTLPRQGSVNGEYGLPVLPLEVCEKLQVAVDGDHKYAVVAFDMDEGWAATLMRTDTGLFIREAEQYPPVRVFGTVTVWTK